MEDARERSAQTPRLGPAATSTASAPSGGLPSPDAEDLVDPSDRARVFESLFGQPDPALRIGRYSVLGTLGRGGMGTVLEAFDRGLDRRVAIKVLHRDLGERQRQRLEREAQALAKLSHPNVVQIYEVGEANGQAFIAMELVEGSSLREWMRREPRPSWSECMEVFVQAGRGLAAAHACGLIHRDFKPDNALVGADGRVRVADFGLARPVLLPPSADELMTTAETSRSDGSVSEGTAALTKTGAILGTIAYMAPEQMAGRPVDARADQFSFCVAFHEAVYGERPFDAKTLMARLVKLSGPPDEPEDLASAPRWLYRVLQRGLSRDPDERFESMDELLAALARPRRRRWWISGVLAVGSATLAATAALAWKPPPCQIDDSALAETWDDRRRAELRSALSGSEQTARTVERALDDWASRWVDAQREACEATKVLGVQSTTALDQRTRCLERQRLEAQAVVDLLATGEPEVVLGANTVLSGLPDAETCRDPHPAEDRFPLPEGPARATIDHAMAQLAKARLLLNVGMDDEVDEIRAELAPLAKEVDYVPLSLELDAIEATQQLAELHYEEGVAGLLTVVREAEALHLDELAATLRVDLSDRVAGYWSKPELEEMLLADADVALRRLGRVPDHRTARLLKARASSLIARGDHEGALAALEQALPLARQLEAKWLRLDIAAARLELGDTQNAEQELRAVRETAVRQWGPRSDAVARVERQWARLDLQRERLDDARAHLDAALDIQLPRYGPDSYEVALLRSIEIKVSMHRGELHTALALAEPLPEIFEGRLGRHHFRVGNAHNAVGVLRFFVQDFSGSIESYERALEITSRVYGPDHPETALLHSNIGESLVELGHYEPALAAFARALEILDRGVDDPILALPLAGRGRARLETGDAAAARVDLERALVIMEAHRGEPLERARIRASLARALVESGDDAHRALASARRAATELRALGQRDRAEAIEAWISRVPPPNEPATPGDPHDH